MKNKKLYLVPCAHLDTQWRWNFATTITHYLKATLYENFRLFEKYPGYCFNFTGAIRYDMIKEYYPEEYARMKDYIREGRWKIAGSCLEETDAIVPSPESLIRNILYGNRFFREEFGTESSDYMLPDCFGFPASLPTVLAHCGIRGFSTQKLTWHSAEGIPFPIGIWRGPDGSGLPAALDPGSYMTVLLKRPGKKAQWLKRLEENGRRYGVWKDYRYYGTGDTGGAPLELSVKNAEKSVNEKDGIVCQDSSDRFFRDLTPDEMARLPEYRGDLLLIEHSTGSLTSQAIMKRWNRKNEFLADAAERASVAASLVGGVSYPHRRLRGAWERVIGSQMHDILPGTCTPDAYTWSYNDEAVALNVFTSVLGRAAEAMAEHLDTRCGGIPLIVYNPLSFEREDLVEAVVPFPGDKEIVVYNPRGESVPVQRIFAEGDESHIIFPAETPPMSWNVYEIRSDTGTPSGRGDVTAEETAHGIILENHAYRVTIDHEGCVASIIDRIQGSEVLDGTVHYELQRETPRMFPAWNMDWKDRKKKPTLLVGTLESVRITERGPVRVSAEITRRFRHSTFIQRVSLSAGSAGSRVEFTERIDWNLSGYSLKAAFPLACAHPEATYNWQVGKVRRTGNHAKQYEVPSHMWFDLTDASGERGVTILEDSKYGSDRPDDRTLRLTLLYTPARRWYDIAFRDQAFQDRGRHTIRYALCSHRGDWREGKSDLQGLRFNQPLYPFLSEPSPGRLGKIYSFLRLSTERAVITALKRSEENGDTCILRMNELAGEGGTAARVDLGERLEKAREVNGQEAALGEISFDERGVDVTLGPYQLKSIALRFASTSPGEAAGAVPLDLPFNAKMITRNGEHPELAFSFPEERVPERIESGDIAFHINRGGERDTLLCGGEELRLPGGEFDRLSLLVSAGEETPAEFIFTGRTPRTVTVTVPSSTGFIGQYDTRIWKRKSRWKKRDYFWRIPCTGVRPGFVTRQELAFFTTHIHAYGKDLPYRFGYMFRLDLEIPEGTEWIRLCSDNRVRIFSATVSRKKTTARYCRRLLDDFDF
ncbi:MAG: alpha-mannosidase [Spirochaetes bacterium]|nr:alpha-mannosidase [Spirochaetota bacterium]